jgi:transposase-like protein
VRIVRHGTERESQVLQRVRCGHFGGHETRRVQAGDGAVRRQDVADIYRQHIDDRPTEAVSRAFGKSHRTAARWVQQAREAGLLPDTTPGKRKA